MGRQDRNLKTEDVEKGPYKNKFRKFKSQLDLDGYFCYS